MIEAIDVVKKFEDFTALDGISCKIDKGCVYGMVGPNGAGKSTFLRVITGVYKPERGKVLIDGSPVFNAPAVKNRMMYVPDELFFLGGSNMKRMAECYSACYPQFDRDRFEYLTRSFGLDSRRPVQAFSKGMRRQASIILALSVHPDYMFFDETFDGLDPVMRGLVKGLIHEDVVDRGVTAIITSHSLRELEDSCDQLALLHKGGLVLQSDVNDLKTSLFKVQIAFKEPFDRETFDMVQVVHFEKDGSVAKLIIRGERESAVAYLKSLHPVILDVLPLTLEEVFIHEMADLGYSFEEVLGKEAKQHEKQSV